MLVRQRQRRPNSPAGAGPDQEANAGRRKATGIHNRPDRVATQPERALTWSGESYPRAGTQNVNRRQRSMQSPANGPEGSKEAEHGELRQGRQDATVATSALPQGNEPGCRPTDG